MAEYIVDEIKFVIHDEEQTTFLPQGYKLFNGVRVGELEDSSEYWELYLSSEDEYNLLVVKEELLAKWVDSKLCSKDEFMQVCLQGSTYFVLITPLSSKTVRLTNFRAKNSRQDLELFSAFSHTRLFDQDSNLRDAIYVSSKSVLLPTYSLVGYVNDVALFKNALRDANTPEILDSTKDKGFGLNYFSVRSILQEYGHKLSFTEPLFTTGELIDDFVQIGENALITSPLLINEQYQLFDTTCDKYVLVMDRLWCEALLSTSLLSQIGLNSLPIDGRKYYVLALDKSKALDQLNNRAFGLDKYSLFDLIAAIRHTRELVPQCSMLDGLYVQELGVVLPLTFTKHEKTEDVQLMRDVLVNGPFALSNQLDEINQIYLDSL